MKARRRYSAAILLAVLLGGCFGAHTSRAGESVWSGLVLATNEEHPAEIPKELKKYATQLKNLFGYNQYELVGQHTELMDNDNEHWLVPGKDFALLVDSKKASKPGYHYRLKLDLYQEKKMLASMESRLCGQNLLFIKGPYYGKGELIIVLVVK